MTIVNMVGGASEIEGEYVNITAKTPYITINGVANQGDGNGYTTTNKGSYSSDTYFRTLDITKPIKTSAFEFGGTQTNKNPTSNNRSLYRGYLYKSELFGGTGTSTIDPEAWYNWSGNTPVLSSALHLTDYISGNLSDCTYIVNTIVKIWWGDSTAVDKTHKNTITTDYISNDFPLYNWQPTLRITKSGDNTVIDIKPNKNLSPGTGTILYLYYGAKYHFMIYFIPTNITKL